MAKFNLQKHGTHLSYANKTSPNYLGFISVIPGTGLFLGIDWPSPAVVESYNSSHTTGCTLLADPPYYYTDSFRYTDIDIRMWNSDWFYRIS
jgi:hypothetical protein